MEPQGAALAGRPEVEPAFEPDVGEAHQDQEDEHHYRPEQLPASLAQDRLPESRLSRWERPSMTAPSVMATPIASRTGKYCSGKEGSSRGQSAAERAGGCRTGTALVKDVTSSGREASGRCGVPEMSQGRSE
jgi:hypothetical protein